MKLFCFVGEGLFNTLELVVRINRIKFYYKDLNNNRNSKNEINEILFQISVLVNNLINRGASTSTADSDLKTPLHHAVRRNLKGKLECFLSDSFIIKLPIGFKFFQTRISNTKFDIPLIVRVK